MQNLITPDAPTYIISSVSTTVITNFMCCSLHERYWRLQNHWGRRRRLMWTCIMVVGFCLTEDLGDHRSVVDSKRDLSPNRWRIPLITIVDNIYKPWVMRQKVCGVSPMQCKYWTLLAMVQAPHWLLVVPCLHLHTWYQGGGGGFGLLNSTKIWKTTIIARPILACLK